MKNNLVELDSNIINELNNHLNECRDCNYCSTIKIIVKQLKSNNHQFIFQPIFSSSTGYNKKILSDDKISTFINKKSESEIKFLKRNQNEIVDLIMANKALDEVYNFLVGLRR